MLLSKIIFGPQPQDTEFENAEDAISEFVGALQLNGQLIGDCPCSLVDGLWTAFVNLTHQEAMLPQHHSARVRCALTTLQDFFGQPPSVEMIDDRRDVEIPSIENAEFLYLFSFAFDGGSPVRCGTTGQLIPLHLISVDDKVREELSFWQKEYNHCDSLWMGSGQLEAAAYAQMADPHSGLSQWGRRLAERVEAATGKPTFYSLIRYYGRGNEEKNRLCPSCGGSWIIDEKNLKADSSHGFAFRCDECRLVSTFGDDDSDDPLAAIGEFDSNRE